MQTQKYKQVRPLLQALQEMQISTIVEAFTLEAICESALGNEEASVVAIHEALKHGYPNKYIRTIIDEKDCLPILKHYLKMRQSTDHTNWNKVPLEYVNYLIEKFDTLDNRFEALTSREMEIFALLVNGATNKEIAKELYLSEGTVRAYRTKIDSKLGVSSRAKAILLAK